MTNTVCAVATPSGEGGIAIVRMSGDMSLDILNRVFHSKSPVRPRYMRYGLVSDASGEVIDEALAIFMPAPHSYTAEDVVEIQCHGGRHVANRVVQALCDSGASPAQPGEFTRRAFLNGRIDLVQAEAVMGIIKAGSDAALRSANRQLAGGMSRRVQEIADSVKAVLAHIEACCDFPEELDEQIETDVVRDELASSIDKINSAVNPRAARMIASGVNVALVGRPNTGKSSILNALAGFDRAIVSPDAGTTRDAVTASVAVDGVLINLVDTAGQRDTANSIEKIGVEIAKRSQNDADVVVVVLDASSELSNDDRTIMESADDRYIIALNKEDLYGDKPAFDVNSLPRVKCVRLSAATLDGIDALKSAIVDMARPIGGDNDILTASRHIELAKKAAESLKNALDCVDAGFPLDLAAVDVQQALQRLMDIRGLDASEETIDSIFSNFCVGK